MRSCVFPLTIISLFTPVCFVGQQTLHSTQATLASASQQRCPVTKPPVQPFVPPPPYWTNPGPNGFWYGTESLWTLLDVQTTWHIRSNPLEGEGGVSVR